MNVFTLQSKSETNFVTKCIFKIKVWLWNRRSIKWKKTVNDRFSELKKREREREVVSSLSEMVDGKPKVLLEIAPFTWTLFLLCWQNPSDKEKKSSGVLTSSHHEHLCSATSPSAAWFCLGEHQCRGVLLILAGSAISWSVWSEQVENSAPSFCQAFWSTLFYYTI